MTERSQGRKKSEFIAKDTVEAGAYFDYVVNGSNFRIPYTDFLSGLGVTGTIVQTGAVTGAPVLDIDGTVHKIRNIENGSGVVTNVSATNGLEIKHNFTASAVGTPILLSTTATSPIVASLVAGTGIALAVSGTTGIQISAHADLYGQVTMQGNSTATAIAVVDTPVKVAGTFVVGIESKFTGDTTGRLTYTGDEDAIVKFSASVTVIPLGTGQNLSMHFAKNGTVITNAKIMRIVSSTESANLSLFFNIAMTAGDYVEVFASNGTTTNNMTVTNCLFGVN
jgi:hypothetical protein